MINPLKLLGFGKKKKIVEGVMELTGRAKEQAYIDAGSKAMFDNVAKLSTREESQKAFDAFMASKKKLIL